MKLNLKKINYHKWIPSRFSSFQAKLLIAFLVATLLPLTLVALVSYHVSYNLARDRITNSALMSDEQLIFQLNSRLNQTENVADTIQYQMYAFEHSSPDQVGTMQALTSMRSNISLYKSTFDFFHIYVFLKPEQTGADEGIYFFSTDKLFNYGISESELHSIGSSSLWLLKKNTTLPRVISASKRSANTLLCFRALQDKSSNVLEYAYCIALDCDEFSRYLQTSASDTAISSYILTPQGQIAAHSDSSRNQTWISDSIKQMFLENTNSFFKDNDIYYNCRTLDNGWLHITEIPENYIKSNTQVLIKTLLITVIISLPLTIFIVILFSRKLTSRIAALSYAMESFHLGHDPEHLSIITLPHPADASNYDEIDNLGITFEDMQHTIAQNLKSIVSLSINEERLKYQLLQSQINPHFLYNTMDMINWMAQQGRTSEVCNAVQSLSRFYKLTLSRKKGISTIAKEEEHVSIYVHLQNMRYHDSIFFISDIPDELMEYQIPKLTLQPVIENSILHGILEKTSKSGTIVLTGWMEDGDIVLLISDDGVGIAPDKLPVILSGEGTSISGGTNIAIYNTHRRLQVLYGADYGLTYSSDVGKGTEVQIRIPAKKDVENK